MSEAINVDFAELQRLIEENQKLREKNDKLILEKQRLVNENSNLKMKIRKNSKVKSFSFELISEHKGVFE